MSGRLIVHFLPGRSAHHAVPMIRSFHQHAREMGLGDAEQLFVLHGVEPDREDWFRGLGPSADQVLLRPDGALDPAILDRAGDDARFVFHSGFFRGMWHELERRPGVCKRAAVVFWGADIWSLLRPAYVPHDPLPRHPVRAYRWMQRRRRRQLMLRTERTVLRRLGAVCTMTPGEMEILERQFGPLGNDLPIVYHTVPRGAPLPAADERRPDDDLRVIVGNSAHSVSRHVETLSWLARFRDEPLQVICPLAYPRASPYKDEVIRMGKRLFGSRFQAVATLRPLEEYDRLLESADVFILSARTQQGLYVIFSGLLRGKKIYLPAVSPVYRMLTSLGARIFDVRELSAVSFPELAALDEEDRVRNHEVAVRHFCLEAALGRWRALFARLAA